MFICGTGNFTADADQTSKRSKRTASFCRILAKETAIKNPYADRGLDKFYALLADLDDKKQKIYTRMGSEDVSFVRFVYTNDETNHVKPIVVKVKERNREQAGNNSSSNNNNTNLVKRLASNAAATTTNNNRGEEIVAEDKQEISKQKSDERKSKKKRYLRCKGSFSLESFRQPYWYFLAIVVSIMVLLAVFGRSFAILCTSIGWYLIPSAVGGCSSGSSANERKPKRKKELMRKPSEKKINAQNEDPASPTSVINGLPDNRKIQKKQSGQKKKLVKLSSI